MVKLTTVSSAEPQREHLAAFKAYASVPDDHLDALLVQLLRTAFKMGQEAADKPILASSLELEVSERDDNSPVVLFQGEGASVVSVTDGTGAPLGYDRRGSLIFPNAATPVVRVLYMTVPDLAEGARLLPFVYQYATALYDGADSKTLANILAQC